MSFLSKLSSLRKSPTAIPVTPKSNTAHEVKEKEPSLLPKNYVREEDPAVKRLKELRRQELLKRGELSQKSKSSTKASTARRHKDNDGPGTETKFKRKVSPLASQANRSVPAPHKKTETIKKLSFAELMKQAENNANAPKNVQRGSPPVTKILSTKPSIEKRSSSTHTKYNGFKKHNPAEKVIRSPSLKSSGSKTNHTSLHKEKLPVKLKVPIRGLAQPNKRIKEKLESKKRKELYAKEREEYESDMDDFIEDDGGDNWSRSNEDAGFDRDEIWALFNRGKKRSDYAFDDYEDDNMEANEMEIFEEEERASKMARIEDKREEEWLKKHEQDKKRRKRMRE